MEREGRLVKSAEFSMGEGKSLVIALSSDIGLDRIIIENKDGATQVRAEGHSRFEFDDTKQRPNQCDFLLRNPSRIETFEDYLDGKFWGQFAWDGLFKYQNNARLKRALKAEIKKLACEFERKAARRLNGIFKKQTGKTK